MGRIGRLTLRAALGGLTRAAGDPRAGNRLEIRHLEQISLGLNRRDSQRPANEGVSCP
jgi:glyceraldehyde 3-phosphate dehydrogenase